MRLNRLIGFLPLILLLSFNFIAAAEEVDSLEAKTSVSDSQQNQKAITKTKPSKRSEVKTLEEFIPSEEVSSDKPVAFPTDI